MMISNFQCIDNTISLHYSVGKYLETHGIPVLGRKNDVYVFSDTDELRQALLKLPFYLKPFAKGGG